MWRDDGRAGAVRPFARSIACPKGMVGKFRGVAGGSLSRERSLLSLPSPSLIARCAEELSILQLPGLESQVQFCYSQRVIPNRAFLLVVTALGNVISSQD